MLRSLTHITEFGALMFVFAIIFESRFERFQFFRGRVVVRYGLAWLLGFFAILYLWHSIGTQFSLLFCASLLSAGLLLMKYRFVDRWINGSK